MFKLKMFNLKICSYVLLIICINSLKYSIAKTDCLEVVRAECHDKDYKSTEEKDLPLFDERIEELPEKCYKKSLPYDCASATVCTKRSGIYRIQIEKYNNESFYALCDDETENGDWLVIQRRQDGSEDFYRNWLDYENGFGDIDGEFLIGLKKLYALTNYNGPQELLIIMEGLNNTKAFAKYESFAIGDNSTLYKLIRSGRYTGTAGNSLQRQIGMKFSTKDRGNDLADKKCAISFTGAWWYNDCHDSNLNGKYGDSSFGKGINWKTFRGYYESLIYVKMMIRPSRTV